MLDSLTKLASGEANTLIEKMAQICLLADALKGPDPLQEMLAALAREVPVLPAPDLDLPIPGNVVCQGDVCACDQGQATTCLTVTSQTLLSNSGRLVATIMDCAPVTNIAPFGICQQLTKLASGTPTPCVPQPVEPWKPGAKRGFVLELPVLTATSTLRCGVGGQITIKGASGAVALHTD